MFKIFMPIQSKSIIIIERHFLGKNHKKGSFLFDLHLFYSIIRLTKKIEKSLIIKNKYTKFSKR